jgi:hypothetical protein
MDRQDDNTVLFTLATNDPLGAKVTVTAHAPPGAPEIVSLDVKVHGGEPTCVCVFVRVCVCVCQYVCVCKFDDRILYS